MKYLKSNKLVNANRPRFVIALSRNIEWFYFHVCPERRARLFCLAYTWRLLNRLITINKQLSLKNSVDRKRETNLVDDKNLQKIPTLFNNIILF